MIRKGLGGRREQHEKWKTWVVSDALILKKMDTRVWQPMDGAIIITDGSQSKWSQLRLGRELVMVLIESTFNQMVKYTVTSVLAWHRIAFQIKDHKSKILIWFFFSLLIWVSYNLALRNPKFIETNGKGTM